MYHILGYKKDTWIAVDPLTGQKIQTLTLAGTQKICPSSSANAIYIGRTGEYIFLSPNQRRGVMASQSYHLGCVDVPSGGYDL